MVSVWKQEDYLSYSERRREIATLRILKSNAHTTGLQGEIDTLCLLLKEKERLLGTVMNTFKRLQSQTDIINERFRPSYPKWRTSPMPRRRKASVRNPLEKNIFPYSAKEKKSAYLRQRKNRKGKRKSSLSVTTGMLYSLNHEVTRKRQAQQRLLTTQMDSLYVKNMDLNRKLNSLIRTLEFESNRRISDRYRRFVSEREHSYLVISFLAISVSPALLFTVYIIIHRELNRKYRYEKGT